MVTMTAVKNVISKVKIGFSIVNISFYHSY